MSDRASERVIEREGERVRWEDCVVNSDRLCVCVCVCGVLVDGWCVDDGSVCVNWCMDENECGCVNVVGGVYVVIGLKMFR